ncbi:MAG: ABC transporter ATP-binding protein [Anaerolineales bacterium]|nr:ABC transporter ATP-binding protein [Anaerolineae bacterium]PWB56284.1 MAG: ABC transporter ATP-binding protein [Anaerolineales bacterium]
MIAVQTEELVKVFGKFSALNGLELMVEEGTIFGFLGPNGAGKTTSIRILTGLAHATSGKAWVLGNLIGSSKDPIAKQIGFLPEEPAFYTWMTPLEFLDYVGRIFGLPSAERDARSKELLQLAGLEDSAKRRIGGFSRGMRQRLALAQALINRPRVLFLDEPASALDPVGRKEVLGFIEQLRGQCTVFMSTHILADVERVCDTVGIINHGKLVTQAPREALLAQYAVPALEVEVDDHSKNDVMSWIESLRNMPWVKVISHDAPTLRVIVNDIELAKKELLTSAVQAGIVFNKYEVVRPSLEDVFMQLVGEEEIKQ